LTFKIDGGKIVVDKSGPREASYDDFLAQLPTNECRYGVFDLDFTKTDGNPGNKILFLSW